MNAVCCKRTRREESKGLKGEGKSESEGKEVNQSEWSSMEQDNNGWMLE